MKSRLFGLWIGFMSLMMGFSSFSQSTSIVVGTGTDMATTGSTQISFDGHFVNNSDKADFSKATFILTGAGQDLTNGRMGTSVTLGGLVVGVNGSASGGTKNIRGGVWEIAGSLVFNDGLVVPQTSSNGKIVHTLSSALPGDITVNNLASYVNGIFYSKGTGTRLFPIGNNSGYFPAQLSGGGSQGDLEIGMQVFNSNAALTHGSEILDVFIGQYWELLDPSQSMAGPLVSLSSLGANSFIDPSIGTVVMGAPAKSSSAISLGGAPLGDFISGSTPIQTTDRVFTLGKISSEQVKVKIHNVITPFLDNANDFLEIENIHLFPNNKVTLLDRWGGKVKEWSGYTNVTGTPDASYDLSKMATGNYICVLEYSDGSARKKLSQMVTIINQ